MTSRTPFDDRSTGSSSATALPQELPLRTGQEVRSSVYNEGNRSSHNSESREPETADDQKRPSLGSTTAPKPPQSEFLNIIVYLARQLTANRFPRHSQVVVSEIRSGIHTQTPY